MATVLVLWLWLGLGISAAAKTSLFLWNWIWTPLSLVRSCRRQGIAEHPRSLPIWQLLSFSKFVRLNLDSWTGLIELGHQEKVFYFVAGTKVRMSIRDPSLVRQILIDNATCYSKPSFIRSLKILGNGLFSASGDLWDNQRQLLGRIFHTKAIKNHFESILTSALKVTEMWGNELENNCREVDINQEFLDIMVELIGKIAFDADLSIPSGNLSMISKSFKRYLHNKWQICFGPAATIPWYKILNMHLVKEIYEDECQLSNLVKEVIKNRQCSNASTLDEVDHDPILIDRLLDAKSLVSSCNISTGQVLDNCLTFLLAGHETTSSLLSWTVYLLSLNQLWQERARAEVQEFFSWHMHWKNLTNLKLINMILFESLRLFPPQPVIGRHCMKKNLVGEYEVDKGMEILIPIAALHRDQDLWGDDANEFRPSRFANGINGACKDPSAYLPFGTGPRTCIGQTLALTEARTILAVMLDNYAWELSPAYKHYPHLQPSYNSSANFEIGNIM
ncbi:hypothetical protein O6H91_06G033400 [Diphasiastrum complanatum]|uniref:Uncharacterized protein n=1 Tax=Diphasiastrum complanatum TaxID=34168 RepID=A0ACC2DCH7_DIPCM|nr:hypothetical protein O6H91_06G033400 [Diphasiastrum complanatum]